MWLLEHVWNVIAHAQKPDLVFQRNGRVHLNRRGSRFSRLLEVEECGSAGRPWIDHVPRHSARVVATLSNRLFHLHFPSHASPCAITFRTAATTRMQYDKALLLLTRVTCSTYVIIKIWRHPLILKHKFLKVILHSYTKSLQFTTYEFCPIQSRKVNVFVNSKMQSKFHFTSQYIYLYLLNTRTPQCPCLFWHQSLGDFSCLEFSTALVNRIFA
jgi:hypothetical protein